MKNLIRMEWRMWDRLALALVLGLASMAAHAQSAIEAVTGSIQGGLYGLTATSIIAAIIVFAARNTPKPGATPVAAIQTPATH